MATRGKRWGARPAWGVAALLALAACTPASPPVPAPAVYVLHTTVEAEVYRVTVRWRGDPPRDREALLLERCARLTLQAGARYFYVVNASEPVGHGEWVRQGGLLTPNLVVPESEFADGGALTALIRIFPWERAPAGYRLYDAAHIQRDRRAGAT